MKLSETGEARIRGYLFVLGRSLRSSLPKDVAVDALREIEGHIRERLEQAESMPNEAASVERVLDELGTPLQVARAYSTEVTVEEAVASGRVAATLRATWLLAMATVAGFFQGLGLLIGYALGLGLLLTAVMTFLSPEHAGLMLIHGIPVGLGVFGSMPPEAEVLSGPGVAAGCVLVGGAALVLTQLAARRLLARWHARRARWLGRDHPQP